LIKDEQIIIVTSEGMMIRFDSNEIGATSRVTAGVKGITLKPEDSVVSTLVIRNNKDALAIFSDRGLGKKIEMNEVTLQKRAGKGLACYKVGDSSGKVAAAALVADEDNVLICGDKTTLCISATEIPSLGRVSLGNQLIKGNKVLSVSKV
jgi:DNA gyrase subunit A